MHIIQETYRKERDSYKLDLAIGSEYIIELFSFPNPPPRPSHPEACGLRHLSFLVENIKEEVAKLDMAGIPHEQIRTDELTNKEFVFLQIRMVYRLNCINFNARTSCKILQHS